MTVRRSRVAAPVIVMAAGIVMAVGCSSGGGLSPHSSGHASTTPTAHPSSSAAAIPNGPQLGALLAKAHRPAGWTFGPGGGNVSTSGSVNMPNNGPTPNLYNCKYVDGGVQTGYITGWWSSSYATMILEYPSQPANLPEVNLTIAAYAPGAAAKDMAKAAALMARCRSFRDPGLHNDPTTDRVTTIPRLGDQNLFLTATEHTTAGTLTGQLLLVRAGNYILAVSNGGTTALRPATVQGFGGWLWQLLEKSKYVS